MLVPITPIEHHLIDIGLASKSKNTRVASTRLNFRDDETRRRSTLSALSPSERPSDSSRRTPFQPEQTPGSSPRLMQRNHRARAGGILMALNRHVSSRACFFIMFCWRRCHKNHDIDQPEPTSLGLRLLERVRVVVELEASRSAIEGPGDLLTRPVHSAIPRAGFSAQSC